MDSLFQRRRDKLTIFFVYALKKNITTHNAGCCCFPLLTSSVVCRLALAVAMEVLTLEVVGR